MNESLPTVEEIREIFSEKLSGADFPRWGKWGREHVGVLLDEIDRLRSALSRILEWDCLCPEPVEHGIKDGLVWLKGLIRDALAGCKNW